MRLGQLARKLSLRPAQLVEFLAKSNIQIEESSNARLEDSHVELLVWHYAPDSLTQITEEIDEVEEVAQMENEQQVIVPVIVEFESTENEPTELPEVIRVPKIELSGLKVLGKIDLPEPKKKEPIVEQKADEITADVTPLETRIAEKQARSQSPNRKPTHQNRGRSRQGPWKNPLELQREREAKAAEERKRTEIEREKEKRRKHYEEKMKSVARPKRVKPVKEQPVAQKKKVDTRPVPRTWFGRFLRWWTT